jgi:hypothetical protein
MIRISFLASITAAALMTGSLSAQEKCAPASPKKEACVPLRNPITLYETSDLKEWGFGVRGDLLYMVYNSPVLTFASEQRVSNATLFSKILSVPGQMSLGCNIALIYQMPNQPGYTFESSWYHIVALMSRTDSSGSFRPAHSVALTAAAPGTVSVNSHLTLNLFDLLIQKSFSLGDWFSFMPGVGLVGGYMNGKSNANFNATSGSYTASGPAVTIASLDYTTKYEGMGLKFDLRNAFKIGKGFKLRADLAYNVLYGFNKLKLHYLQNGLYASTLNQADSSYAQHDGRDFFDAFLGLAWETLSYCGAYYADIHAGWRFQSFSSGWKEFEAEFNDSVHELSLQGQGLQAGATVKF